MVTAYKLARPDGWDFFTGKTIQYRSSSYPHTVKIPKADSRKGICTSGVGHASEQPNDCFVGAKIPCSAFLIRFQPVCGDKSKWGWIEAEVLEEIADLDTLFGWKYSEVLNPLNPFTLPSPDQITARDLELLKTWVSVRKEVRASVGDSVWASVGASVRASVGAEVRNEIWASVGASVGDSVGAYIGALFLNITNGQYAPKKVDGYPYQAVVDLWKRGLVPSFDGMMWRLHTGVNAQIVYAAKLS